MTIPSDVMHQIPNNWKPSDKLNGRTAIITGATGTVGRLVAILFAIEGCDLVLTTHPSNEQQLKELSELITNKYKRRCWYKAGDLSKREFAHELIEFAASKFEKLDCIAHLAKYRNNQNSLGGWSEDDLIYCFNVGTVALFTMIRYAVNKNFFSKYASVVMSCSAAALSGDPHQLPLACVSGACVAMVKSLSEAQECIRLSIRVNAVVAGHIKGSGGQGAGDMLESAKSMVKGRSTNELTSFDVAAQYLHLASPQTASGVTGTTIEVTHGRIRMG